jgi:hypothetical protein
VAFSILPILWAGVLAQKYDRILFWLSSFALILFASCRPFGVGLDDMHYSMVHYQKACPSFQCGKWFQEGPGRDQFWYTAVGLLKSICPSPRVMLWLAGIGLFLKVLVLDRLCKQRCLALLFYYSCFYIIHDVTALRVSLAISGYLIAIYLLANRHFLSGLSFLTLDGFFHRQAFLAPLVLISRWPHWSIKRFQWAMLLPVVLLIIRIYPNDAVLDLILQQTWGKGFIRSLVGSDIDYLGAKLKGAYDHVHIIPVVVPPTVILSMYLLSQQKIINRELLLLCGASLVLAAWLLWAYAAFPDVQLRFWHFF